MTVLLGLSTALMWAFTDLCNTHMSRRAGEVAGAFWLLAIGCLPLLPVTLLVEDLPAHVEPRAVAAAVAAGVLNALGVLFLLRGLRTGSLALVAPLTALEGGVAAIGSILLGADTSVALGVGLALAVLGGVLAATGGPGGRTADGAVWGLLAALAFGGVLLLLEPATDLGELHATLLLRIVATLTILPIALRRRVVRPGLGIGRWALLAGTLDAAGFVFYAAAASRGPLSVAAVTAAQFATVGAILGLVVLHERLQRRQLAGIAVTLAGVTVLAVA